MKVLAHSQYDAADSLLEPLNIAWSIAWRCKCPDCGIVHGKAWHTETDRCNQCRKSQKKEHKMSWSIETVGRPLQVVAEVESNAHIPEALKAAVRSVAAEVGEEGYLNGVSLQTFGHIGGMSSNIKFECKAAHLAPPLPTSPPAVSNENVAAGCEQFSSAPPAASPQ